MINSNLENDLKEWCKTSNDQLFTDFIYQPLRYLAVDILSKYKYNVKSEDRDNIINDMVSTVCIKLPECYDESRGKCKSMVYIIMKQYLIQNYNFNSKQKRDITKTLFLEDLDNDMDRIIEIELDEFQLMKNTLLENKHLLLKLKSKLNIRIVTSIINAIENPLEYQSNMNSFIGNISLKCNTNARKVHSVIHEMKKIMVRIK